MNATLDESVSHPVESDVASVAAAFLRTAARQARQVAARTSGGAQELTWTQLRERVRGLAAGLQRLGVGPGDTVALLLKNRPEFMVADLAAMCLGAVPFSLYPTLPPGQIAEQLDNADARVALTEEAFLPQLQAARRSYPALADVIVLEGAAAGARAWLDVETEGMATGFDLAATVAAIVPQQLATLVYTSGTTGPAKGVELSHATLLAGVRTNGLLLGHDPERRYLSWLPTAGMAERITSHYYPIVEGGTVTFCDDPRRVAEVLPDAAPNIFFGAPRFWEKLKAGIEARWAALPAAERSRAELALADGLARVRAEQEGHVPDAALMLRLAAAERKLFAPTRRAIGLGGRDVYVASGGASAPMAVLEFFHAIGLPLDEAYGMTESSSFGTRNPRGRQRLGTVGRQQPGVEVKLAADGEILIRAPATMTGYRHRADATAEMLDPEGWLHTGDIGTMDADGYLRIVDRKKDLIVGSHGKKMSPVAIESAIITAGVLVSQTVVIGNGYPYNVALLTLDPVQLAAWASKNAPESAGSPAASIGLPALRAEVEAQVRRGNAQLARIEQVKRFHIAGTEWPPGGDEVTPTMKLKRRAIEKRYAAEIAAMYAELTKD